MSVTGSEPDSAEEIETNDVLSEEVTAVENEISEHISKLTVSYDELTDSAVEILEEYGMDTDEKSEISFPVMTDEKGEDIRVICVKSLLTDDTEKIHWLISFINEEDELKMDQDPADRLIAELSGPYFVSTDHYYNDNGVYIHGYAYKNRYDNGYFDFYYLPYGAAFYYTVSSGGAVSYIKMQYKSVGNLYTYPGLISLDMQYKFNVICSKNNPSTGIMYSCTNSSFPSGRVMQYTGSPFVGEFVYFTVTVDGVTYGYTIEDCPAD